MSVIIPTYNRAKLLPRAVDSVQRQTCRDLELIVVDDGSTDSSVPDAISRNSDFPIKVIRNARQCGAAAARNRGAERAGGKLLAFLDSDDEWHPDKVCRQLHWMHENPEFRICQTHERWIRNGRRVNPPHCCEKRHGYQFAENTRRCLITVSSVVLEKSLFFESGAFNESLPACEDYDLWLTITSRYPVGLLPYELLTRYGGHEDQLSSSLMGLDRFRIRSLLDHLASGTLTPLQSRQVQEVLCEKAMIVANGFRKRGKELEYERFSGIARKYRTPVESRAH